MTKSRSAVFLVALALLQTSLAIAGAQKAAMSSTSIRQEVLSLDFANNGQHVSATVGQQIEITLGSFGPRRYGTPQISSSTIRLENIALAWPPPPSYARHTYIFEAAAEGEAQVTIPNAFSDQTFTVTIQVGSAAAKAPVLHASMTPDQANTAVWKKAWTTLVNNIQQTFTPSLPRLTAVEVELALGNPGPPDAEVAMTVLDAEGIALAYYLSKTVPVTECGHVLFVFPNGGLRVSPGQVYSIRLSGGTTFGWKYVVGGYEKGSASFNGKPLLPNTRSTFLFRTFGSN